LRVGHGLYVLNPALEVEVKGAWVSVGDTMGLSLLFDSLAAPSGTEYLRRWMERVCEEVAARFGGRSHETVGREESEAAV
jgi:hypothetical protein